jgi:hypothetical protein
MKVSSPEPYSTRWVDDPDAYTGDDLDNDDDEEYPRMTPVDRE